MRYGLISFLNARPLWWGLVNEPQPDESFVFSSPAECARIVREREVDLGLIPAIELVRAPELLTIPGFCIASESEVRSVLVISRVPFDQIRSVLLDPASKTSVALCRILLAERLGEAVHSVRFDALGRKETGERAATIPALLGDHDAAVVIGDPALMIANEARERDDVFVYDLASEWHEEFAEPFVFGVWAGHRDRLAAFDAEETRARLAESLDRGREAIPQIAAEAASELALHETELIEYFRDSLHYSLGGAELAALERFHELARLHGVAEGEGKIEWFR